MDHDLILILTETEERYREYANARFDYASARNRTRPEFAKTRAEWLRLADRCAELLARDKVLT